MGKHIKLFANNLERGTYEGSADYIEPYVSYVEDDKSVHYNIGDVFCRLYLNDNTVVNIEGEGKLTRDHIADYVDNIVKVEIGKKCTELQGAEQTETDNIQSTFHECPALREVYISTQLETIPTAEFEGCTNLKIVSIPYSVTSIERRAFYQCDIRNVILPKNLISIGSAAFSGCPRLKTVSGDTHMTSISDAAFQNCSNLESINLGDSITSIGSVAFQHCDSLKNIDLPNTITDIGNNAFASSGLVSIKIPDNIVEIPEKICLNCSQLENIEFGKSNAIIGTNAFMACPKLKDIVIPNTITTLRNACFSGSNCNSVTIPNSVTTINGGALAFSNIKEMYYDSPVVLDASLRGGYTGLEKVVVGDTTTTITQSAFGGTSVKEVIIGKNVTTITGGAFSRCNNLEKLVIPDNVENLTGGPFSGCTKLKELTLGKGITTMTSESFSGAPLQKVKYTGTIEEFTSINDYHFWAAPMVITSIQCKDGDYIIPFSYKLTLIDGRIVLNYVASGLPVLSDYSKTVVTIETGPVCANMSANACAGCSVLETVKLDDNTVLSQGAFMNSSIKSISFGKNITVISRSAFSNCFNLDNVIIPDSVIEIDIQAFNYCTALHNIVLSNNLTTIKENAFSNTSLDKITLPQSLRDIKDYAFSYTRLKEVTLPKNVTTLGSYVFGSDNQVDTFIIQSPHLIEASYDDANNLRNRLGPIRNLIIDCNPSKLGQYILAYTNINNITIPNSVTEIEKNAFFRCDNLTKVKLPANLVTVGVNAFYETKIDKLRLPNNIITIKEGAFRGIRISVIDITDKVEYLGTYSFGHCKLQNVIIGKSVTNIDNYAFINSNIPINKITLKPITPPSLGNTPFYVSSATVIYVPKESVDAYKAAWSDYAAYIKPSK